MVKAVLKQIQSIHQLLIKESFSIAHNYPTEKDGFIAWENFRDISFALKNQPYDVIYAECIKEKAYNFMMIDGAIIQLLYRFDKKKLTGHRLAYYPNPTIERYVDFPNDYEEIHFGHELFSDITPNKTLVFPIRFDFDSDPSKYVEYEHPYVHLTIGNNSDSRIPVTKPLTPNKFISFILFTFYLKKYKEKFSGYKTFSCNLDLGNFISAPESQYVHISH